MELYLLLVKYWCCSWLAYLMAWFIYIRWMQFRCYDLRQILR